MCTLLFGLQQAMLPKVLLAGLASLGFAFTYPALMGETSEDGLEHRSELGNIACVQRIFVNAGFVLGPVIGGFVASRYGIQKAFFELGAVMLVCFVPITIAMMRFRVAGRIHKRILAEFDM